MSHALRVGASIDPNDSYRVQVSEAAYARARELPLDLVSISLVEQPESLSPEEQMALVEELLALELDALIAWEMPEGLAYSFLQFGLPLIILSETEIGHPLAVSPVGLYDVTLAGGRYLAEHMAGCAAYMRETWALAPGVF